MKVYIKNKIISWGGGSTVLDENKNEIYKVKGKVFSPTRKNAFAICKGMFYIQLGISGLTGLFIAHMFMMQIKIKLQELKINSLILNMSFL